MIAGKIKNINMCKGISKNLDKAIDSIIKGEFLGKEPGKYKIDEENVFFNVQELTTKSIEESFFETHQKYIDIQIVINGAENYGVLLSDKNLEVIDPFDVEKDFGTFKKEPHTIFTITPEDFIIFFTNEPHMPGLKIKEKSFIKKVVYKIII